LRGRLPFATLSLAAQGFVARLQVGKRDARRPLGVLKLMTTASPRRWLQYLVWIPLGTERESDEYRIGILTLRQIETWLRDHHAPRALFDASGRPKGQLVSVSFDRSELGKALAYRIFCNELGLSHTLRQCRIVQNLCQRTRLPN
jgi:hypothetical protein